MYLGLFLLSAAWVLHVDQAIHLHGLNGESIPLLRVFLGGLIITNTVSLVGNVVSYYVFLIPIILGLAAEIFLVKEPDSHFPLIYFLAFSMICLLGLHTQHRQLRAYLRARDEADRERRRFRRLIDGVPGFVGVVDPDGVYTDGNTQILEFYPGLVGTKVGELSRDSAFSRFVWSFLSTELDTATSETQVVMNGENYHLISTCKRIDDGAVIICIPINELVKAREDVRDKEIKANFSAKLASIGQMAAGVAHEVNNPLAIIQGSAGIIAGLVEEENIDRKNLKLFSERIVATTDRISQIVRSLRSLSRGGEQDPFSPLSLKKLISSCEDLSHHNLRAHDIELSINGPRKDISVLGREVQLGQVLLNLLSNSIDAVKDLPERWIRIEYGHSDGHAWVEVSDSGPKIPPEVADRLMEPFFTTKKTEGTGLGLPISVKIIEEHGGKLQHLPERPHTVFRFAFPTPKI